MLKFKNVFAWMHFGPKVTRIVEESFLCKSEVNMIHKILDRAMSKSSKIMVIQKITIDSI